MRCRQVRSAQSDPVMHGAAREQREPVARGDQREQPGDVAAVVDQRRFEPSARAIAASSSSGAQTRRRVDPARVDEVLERRPSGPAAGGRPAPRPRAPPPRPRPRSARVSGRRSGSLTAATPSTKPDVELAGRDRARDLEPRARPARSPSAPARPATPRAPQASGVVPIRSERGGPPATRATSARAASRRSRIGSACSSSRAPASVGATGRRVSSVAPRSASSTPMCWETADCV